MTLGTLGMRLLPKLRIQIAACSIALLTACTPFVPQKQPPGNVQSWSGRLSISIDSEPSQHTSASFSLQGGPSAGQLNLFSPLGSKVAQVDWQTLPISSAIVVTNRGQVRYLNLSAALEQLTGSSIPTEALFGWLNGEHQNTSGGWQADFSRYATGRISATRLEPLPKMTLRIVLEN